MNKINWTNFVNGFYKAKGNTTLWYKKNSPALKLGAGIIFGIAGVVGVAVQSTKVDEVVEDTKAAMDDVRAKTDAGIVIDKDGQPCDYTDHDRKVDTFRVAVNAGVDLAKLYSVPFTLLSMAGACVLSSHKDLNSRYLAATSAAEGLSRTLEMYRARVREKLGDEEERDIFYNAYRGEREVISMKEDGTTETETVDDYYIDPDTNFNVYCKFFDESSPLWTKSPDENKWRLAQAQREAQMKLQRDGYLFLNDVYRSLGIRETREGQIAGWIYEYHADQPSEEETTVDFGLRNVNDEGVRTFVNGYSPSVLLDFNANGHLRPNILDALD